ncbi:hypothetical protein KI387_019043, partial [Taxus chinensis]
MFLRADTARIRAGYSRIRGRYAQKYPPRILEYPARIRAVSGSPSYYVQGELRNYIVSKVEQSFVLNTPGAETMSPSHLYDAILDEIKPIDFCGRKRIRLDKCSVGFGRLRRGKH